MIKDITIGQFFPGQSVIHRLDPRVKVILTFVFIVIIFFVKTYAGYGLVFAYIGFAVWLSGVPIRYILKGLKPLLFIIVLTFFINVFFTPGNRVLFQVWVLKFTQEGLNQGIFMALRLVLLVVGTSLLTLTTSPISLTDGIERLLQPLQVVRFPAHELAMMMTIALRFIPTLLEETDKIMKAQMARGADFETGNLFQRAKALVPLLVPLFISAFRRADELAMAMESRCYRGGKNRTRMKVLKATKRDYIAVGVTLLLVAGILLDSYVL
ncbi:energy-coupling factor transport system permease protein [Caldicoprobacter guelmensis]|uniref:energy-coupling factor transporter transmembrane component T family protein n=1 Tax=Caldicoprobacter guelmensis TaxID=1170224 RepID=UPI00195CA8EB|nr:energy-coupling factor transporter transmembrane component T [Caldicoprobacter guelmensis]MBM7583052.1 energy-coupling factor transport system permease protein [Caldicoprobacter guelmensis]